MKDGGARRGSQPEVDVGAELGLIEGNLTYCTEACQECGAF
jgi:hypothetical protein